MTLGGRALARLRLGDAVVYEAGGRDYEEVEWARNGSRSWVDTGVPISDDLYYHVRFVVDEAGSGVIVGCEDMFRFFITGGNFYFDYNRGSERLKADGALLKKEYHLECGNHYIKNLDTGLYIDESTRKTWEQSGTLRIWGEMNSDRARSRVYSLDIYNAEGLQAKLRPVRRVSDNEIGFYDLLNKRFLERLGDAHFSAGEPTGNYY